MRAVVQRVNSARCEVDGAVIGEIEAGLLVFLGIGADDGQQDVEYLVKKISGLRIFEDEAGKMNFDVGETGGGVLVIPQFTLYGDVRRGLRPSFHEAAPPGDARKLCDLFVKKIEAELDDVAAGQFGAMMEIRADNDGPVTIIIDSDETF